MPLLISLSRREFLLSSGAAGAFLLKTSQPGCAAEQTEVFDPHYRSHSPLHAVLQKVDPSKDVFPTEVIAHELNEILLMWRESLMKSEPEWKSIAQSLSPGFKGSRLSGSRDSIQRESKALRVWKRVFQPEPELGPTNFITGLANESRNSRILWAEFNLTSVKNSGPLVRTLIRYDLVQTGEGYYREQRTGWMELAWEKSAGNKWEVMEWRALNEQCSRSAVPLFQEITPEVLGSNSSFRDQLAKGTDYWRSILDGACGIDIYGNYGVAAGDFDNDGWDDLYVCQPAGLPNRLYRNNRDGTFEDVTEEAGVGILDSSPMALFADLNNDGRQDLVVTSSAGPLLFLNQGDRTFHLKENAFRFASRPQGTFTGAAIADYDRDGWLDIYFCLYSYYRGLSRYRYPVPYYNAQNGPPNFLFRNNRDGTFRDVTHETGLDRNNNRFSFACAWCDYDQDGRPDLYVANDFGQKNLYRQNVNGTFTDVAGHEGVLDTGAGMSVCWFDYDNDGRQDLYVANMWTAAGLRITQLENFMSSADPGVRALYRKHAMGNSLFHNVRPATFRNVTDASQTAVGRWAWSSDAWDFDYDGFEDLYIANGMISGPDTADLSSFFWRQVVARSPQGSNPTQAYEAGWNAINELIRADGTWNGYERNLLYLNNRDGTFADISGAAGIDCVDDSRSFALADIDHDGRQELILKNRTGPQVRIFRNVMPDSGNTISFRLKGHKSTPDAIGATVTVRGTAGRQSKVLQAGSGFLAQHSKEMFFGIGKTEGTVRVQVVWPSGMVQEFAGVPVGHRIEIEEGAAQFSATAFAERSRVESPGGHLRASRHLLSPDHSLPSEFETWLVAPIAAPDFTLPDVAGKMHHLAAYRGRPVLVNFWESSGAVCIEQLRDLHRSYPAWQHAVLLAVNVDEPQNGSALAAFVKRERLRFPVLKANPEASAVYNLLYRYTFDRRRNLAFPISFLIDSGGNIVKIYRRLVPPKRILHDALHIPATATERWKKALPYGGAYYGGAFTRNYFTYGVAFAQHGYSAAAEAAFKRAIREEPGSADSYYDLGTLYMQQGKLGEAEALLERAVQVKPDDLLSYNNLGVISIRRGEAREAERYFNDALKIDPGNTLAIDNLADLYRTQGRIQEAQQLVQAALDRQPDSPELNYKLAMIFASMGRNHKAQVYLEKAVRLQPDNPMVLDNLGVVYALTGQLNQAAQVFSDCIQRAPKFDQAYLNLAKVDVKLGRSAKAEQVLRALLREHPGHPLAEKYLQALEQ